MNARCITLIATLAGVGALSTLCSLSACAASSPGGFATFDTPPDSGAQADAPVTPTGSGSGETFTPTDAGAGGPDACTRVSETETKCDGIDDDCNGRVDDVDVGHDGICDCIRIGLVGKPGYYGSNDFQKWLQQRGTTVTRIQATTNEALTAAQLASFDMVILDWLLREYTPAEAQIFQSWLDAKHGVLALSGFAEAYRVEWPNSLMKVVGLSFTRADTFAGRQTVTEFDVHPLTTDVKAVSFVGGSEVLTAQSAAAGKRTAFARLGGRVVGTAHESETSRGVAWGDEFIEFDSEWSTLPDINRFWANIVSFLTPRCEVAPPPK